MPSVGRKFLMAGRGGLNLTHSENLDRFLPRYGEAEVWLAPAIAAFPPPALRAWCEGLGQATFVGSSGRVFPERFKASPLLRAWLARLDGLGVRVATRHRWEGWTETGHLAFVGPGGPLALRPDATVLALGGASWPRLGSDGHWIAPLARVGVTVAPLRPANGGFVVPWSEHFRARFAGEPLKRIALSFGGRTVKGEAMITAGGVEGGAIYALSGPLRDAIAAEGEARPVLDLRPDLADTELETRLATRPKAQSLSTFLRKAAGLSPVAIGLLREGAGSSPPPVGPALAALIKAMPLRLIAPAPITRAISTAGGVALDEIDAGFMLRRRPGVFVAGEMLDWEAPTGGYLLQASLATGVAAARGVLDWLAEDG